MRAPGTKPRCAWRSWTPTPALREPKEPMPPTRLPTRGQVGVNSHAYRGCAFFSASGLSACWPWLATCGCEDFEPRTVARRRRRPNAVHQYYDIHGDYFLLHHPFIAGHRLLL